MAPLGRGHVERDQAVGDERRQPGLEQAVQQRRWRDADVGDLAAGQFAGDRREFVWVTADGPVTSRIWRPVALARAAAAVRAQSSRVT